MDSAIGSSSHQALSDHFGVRIMLVQKEEDFRERFKVTISILDHSTKMRQFVSNKFQSKNQVMGTSSFVKAGPGFKSLQLAICLDVEILQKPFNEKEEAKIFSDAVLKFQILSSVTRMFGFGGPRTFMM